MLRFLRWLVVGVLVCSPSVFASVAIQDSAGTYVCEATTIRGGASCADGSTAHLATVSYEKRLNLPIGSFTGFNNTSNTAFDLHETDLPGLSAKSGSGKTFIRWADGTTHRVETKFRIPSDYLSGGQFRVTLGRSGAGSSPPQLAFAVLIDKNATAYDTAATAQTAVAVSSSVGSGSPEQKTLTVATDFGSLVAQDEVTVQFWSAVDGNEDLELYHAEFFYTARD